MNETLALIIFLAASALLMLAAYLAGRADPPRKDG